jgi:hypothetical protein
MLPGPQHLQQSTYHTHVQSEMRILHYLSQHDRTIQVNFDFESTVHMAGPAGTHRVVARSSGLLEMDRSRPTITTEKPRTPAPGPLPNSHGKSMHVRWAPLPESLNRTARRGALRLIIYRPL